MKKDKASFSEVTMPSFLMDQIFQFSDGIWHKTNEEADLRYSREDYNNKILKDIEILLNEFIKKNKGLTVSQKSFLRDYFCARTKSLKNAYSKNKITKASGEYWSGKFKEYINKKIKYNFSESKEKP